MKVLFLFGVVLMAAYANGTSVPAANTIGGCDFDGVTMKEGETKASLPGTCMSITCKKDGSISGVGCGVATSSKKGCNMSAYDMTKPYPDCCPKLVCT